MCVKSSCPQAKTIVGLTRWLVGQLGPTSTDLALCKKKVPFPSDIHKEFFFYLHISIYNRLSLWLVESRWHFGLHHLATGVKQVFSKPEDHLDGPLICRHRWSLSPFSWKQGPQLS